MLRKFVFATAYLVPAAALAGDGGGEFTDGGALLIQAIGGLVGKLAGLF